MDMGLVSALSSIQQANTRQQIDVAVAKKSMDAQRQQGDAVLQLLNAAMPGDAATSQATGLGGQIDVRA